MKRKKIWAGWWIIWGKSSGVLFKMFIWWCYRK